MSDRIKISSQRYLDDDIVAAKLADGDFIVTLARISDADGNEYDVVIDGHHSIAAAKEAGVSPVFEHSDYNYQKEVTCIGFDGWLAQHCIDAAWYDIDTDIEVW